MNSTNMPNINIVSTFNFVCFSQNNWEKRKARKHLFMIYLSERQDVSKVLYVEPHLNFSRLLIFPFGELINNENRNRWKRALMFKFEKITGKLYLFTPIFFIPFAYKFQWIYNLNLSIMNILIKGKLTNYGFNKPVLWLYHPLDYKLIDIFKDRAMSVFDQVEEWSDYFIELNKKRRTFVRKCEEYLFKKVDFVFVTTSIMLEDVKRYTKNVYHMMDGTVIDVFRNSKSIDIPDDIKNIPRPILGYLGTISDRIDVDLLALICESNPMYSVVLIGNLHKTRINTSKLLKYNNIYFLGGKEYFELGKYAKQFDVNILPYKPEYMPTFPTKIFDYLATGKPIVTTNIPEIQKYEELLNIAKTNHEFVSLLGKALNDNSDEMVQKRIKTAEANTWAKRAEEIITILKRKNEETVYGKTTH